MALHLSVLTQCSALDFGIILSCVRITGYPELEGIHKDYGDHLWPCTGYPKNHTQHCPDTSWGKKILHSIHKCKYFIINLYWLSL